MNSIIIETQKIKCYRYAWGLVSTCIAIITFIVLVLLCSFSYNLFFLFFLIPALYWVFILVIPIYRVPYRFDISPDSIVIYCTSLTGESHKYYSKNLVCLCYSYNQKSFGIQIKNISRSLIPFLYYGNLLDKKQWSCETLDKLLTALKEFGFEVKQQHRLRG